MFFILSKDNNIKHSIVFIEASNNEYLSKGMGFVYKIEKNINYIVTSYHVIDNSEIIYVYNLDNDKIKAQIVDYDKYTDLALLKIDDKLNLKEIKISNNNVNKSDEVYYFDIDNNIREKGKVLSLNNEIFLETSYGNSYYEGISIDGNISEGNSGGPVLNKKNEVIGLIALKEKNKNTSIFLPIEDIMKIVSKLENHSLRRPNLGAIFSSVTNKEVLKNYNLVTTLTNGVVILDLFEDYPLKESNFKIGDIIVSINEEQIKDIADFRKKIYSFSINDEIKIKFYRNDRYYEQNIVLYK